MENLIKNKMLLFKKYLDETNMEHKKYQYDGVKWCLYNELGINPHNIHGGFIADEMGLGKTIMMIGLMYCNFMPNTLIVVPNILLRQWEEQIYRTTYYKPLIYYGENKKKVSLDKLSKSYIVITTYNTISLNKNNIKNGNISLLHKINWKRIIYDEAHHLRNNNISRYNGAYSLKTNITWLVSGTPIQNKKKDFYNLCSILRLPSNYYTDNDNLLEILKYFILKRTKKSVNIEMTELIVIDKKITWKSNYEKNVSQELHSGLKFCACDLKRNKTHSLLNSVKSKGILPLLLYSKQFCIYPKLLYNKINTLYNTGYINDFDYNYYCNAINYSSKLDALIDNIIKNKNNNCGKLIFCHFRGEINEIYKRLNDNGFDNIAILDGRFNEDKKKEILKLKKNILILQIQVGCEGLNLQEYYSEIYFVSNHWNPSIEDQAIARCHRIGQKKCVYVYKYSMDNFNTNDTNDINDNNDIQLQIENNDIKPINIDNYIQTTQLYKRNLISNFLDK